MRYILILASLATAALCPAAKANFVVNGNFESGNTGFTSSYQFGLTGPQASYNVLTSPFPSHPSAADYGDHTTGTGLMFVGNGATSPNVVFWSQTIAVTANTDYIFSMWTSSWVAANPSTFDVLFNGSSIGTPAAPTTVAVWQEFATTWNSGSSTSVTINLIETRRADIGSDFAVDDISLTEANPVPAPSSLWMAISGALAGLLFAYRLRRRIPAMSTPA